MDFENRIRQLLEEDPKEARKLVCLYRRHLPIDEAIDKIAEGLKIPEEDKKTAEEIIHMYLRVGQQAFINPNPDGAAALRLAGLISGRLLTQHDLSDFLQGKGIAGGTTTTLRKYEREIAGAIVSNYSNLYSVYPLLGIFVHDAETVVPDLGVIVARYEDVFDPCGENPVAHQIDFSEKIPAGLAKEQMNLVKPFFKYSEFFHFRDGVFEFTRNYGTLFGLIDKQHGWVHRHTSASFYSFRKFSKYGLVELGSSGDEVRANHSKYNDIHSLTQLPEKFMQVFEKHGYKNFTEINLT